jgi:hypothetical protein
VIRTKTVEVTDGSIAYTIQSVDCVMTVRTVFASRRFKCKCPFGVCVHGYLDVEELGDCTKNIKHQQMHEEFFFLLTCNTLLHVSTLLQRPRSKQSTAKL